jgi:hypothetical protein
MHPRTTQADKDAEFRRGPLRGRRAAVAAAVVLGGFLDLEELQLQLAWNTGKGGRRKDLRSSLGIYLPHGFARHACVCFSLLRFSFLGAHSRRLAQDSPNKQIDQFKQPMRKAQNNTMSLLQFESRSIKNRSSRGVLYCSGESLAHKGGLNFGGFGLSAMHTNDDDAGRG